jgi:hypothetical protein
MKQPVNLTVITTKGKVTHHLLTECSALVRRLNDNHALTGWLYAWWQRGRNDYMENDDVGAAMLRVENNTPAILLTRYVYSQGVAGLNWTEALQALLCHFPAVLADACGRSGPTAPRDRSKQLALLLEHPDTAEGQMEGCPVGP